MILGVIILKFEKQWKDVILHNLNDIQLYVTLIFSRLYNQMVQNIQLTRSSIISDIYLNKGLMTVCQNKTSENLVGELLICSSRLAPGSLKNSFVLIVITMGWNISVEWFLFLHTYILMRFCFSQFSSLTSKS